MFRAKDIWSWWSNLHYDRSGGSESATHTGWVPQSKPIWFTELGCPAVDKGANEPNVFFDPKSSESFLPYYSNGGRDDLMQRRFLEAQFNFWNAAANNPASSVYSGRMVDTANTRVWCWDARPYPFFPQLTDVWSDGGNYTLGHWLNGRLGGVLLADLVLALCADANFAAADVSDLDGVVTGFAVTDTMSPRDAINPLSVGYQFDGVESEGKIKFVMRGRPDAIALGESDLVIPDGEPDFGFSLTRAQETDLPLASRVSYIDAGADYRQAVVEARRLVALSDRVAQSSLPIVMDQTQASGIGARLLQDAWVMREAAQFALAPSQMGLDPTDEVALNAGGRDHRLRLTQIDDAGARTMQAVATDPSIYDAIVGPQRAAVTTQPLSQAGRALTVFLDLPMLTSDQVAWDPFAAAYANPWPGGIAILRSASDANYQIDTTLAAAAAIGETTTPLYSGPVWRWDTVNSFGVTLYNGALASLDDLSVLGGGNALAIQNEDGGWEVLQFANAELTAPQSWTLSRLLRGQAGSEAEMRNPVAAGARIVLLDGALQQLSLGQNQATLPFNYLWGPIGKPISDPAFQNAQMQFQGIGQRPLSPVHVTARWQDGDLLLAWIRRTRIGGDSWDQSEVPLGEETESYDLEILNGASVVRSFSGLTSPSALYTAVQQAADFAGPVSNPLAVRVYQNSAAFGRGQAKMESLYVR